MAAVGIWTQGAGQQGQQEMIPLEFFENYRVNYFQHPTIHGRKKRQHQHQHHHNIHQT
jgi:hypothetical protein